MSGDDALIVYDQGPIRHIRLNRPHKLNAIDSQNHDRVINALNEAEMTDTVRVIAFSGEGRAFSSGDDVKTDKRSWSEGLKGAGQVLPERHHKRIVDLEVGIGPLLLQEVTTNIRNVLKPTVVMMHGYSLGAGYDYATSCDFRVATEDCRLGDPRVHLALWAAEGWSYKLLRLVPGGWSTRIALIGRLLTGVEAREMGLVHKTYPPDADLRESAHDFLMQLADLPLETYALIKRHVIDGLDLSYDASLAHCPNI